MKGKGWKWLTLVGLGTSLAAFTGCDEQSARETSRQVGREVGEATKELQEGAREAAKEAQGAAREAAQGFREGRGGSGNPDAGVDVD
ncbi:hypothetical protein HV824_10775 [Myxococcus sp. AM009]|uniref:hypothetical protein n=1 Tax=Myxococcus sp. AM009 TaxID=2745137 RepID=UPI001595AA3E|nr:hypothetical protein [Myxococcus sp. AM009]NVI98601.1 hypothetical protein [Myxococcus sp. AM009]